MASEGSQPWLCTAAEEKVLQARLMVPTTQLGEGACGKVLLCTSPQGPVAVKIVRTSSTTPGWPSISIIREAKLLSRLQHRNIIGFYGSLASQKNMQVFLKLEYAPGGSLDARIKAMAKDPSLGFIPEATVWTWLSQILNALAFLHRERVVHRDIKPRNILLAADESVRVCDFGSAKEVESEDAMIERPAGTSYYLAPEICVRELYDNRCDTWALGCTVHEMCTLRKTFPGATYQDVVQRILSGKRRKLDPQKYSGFLQQVVDVMLTPVMVKRPRARDLAKDRIIRDKAYERPSFDTRPAPSFPVDGSRTAAGYSAAPRPHYQESGNAYSDLGTVVDLELSDNLGGGSLLREVDDRGTPRSASPMTVASEARRGGGSPLNESLSDHSLASDHSDINHPSSAYSASTTSTTVTNTTVDTTITAATTLTTITNRSVDSAGTGRSAGSGRSANGLRGMFADDDPPPSRPLPLGGALPPPSDDFLHRAASSASTNKSPSMDGPSLLLGRKGRAVSSEVKAKQDKALQELRAQYK